jgi:hypothetical protein
MSEFWHGTGHGRDKADAVCAVIANPRQDPGRLSKKHARAPQRFVAPLERRYPGDRVVLPTFGLPRL